MSRQLTSGVLGRRKNLAVQLANEYIARVTSEPYSLIGAGILNWDVNGNPPTDLFDGSGNINTDNYDSVAAKNAIISAYENLLIYSDIEDLGCSFNQHYGFTFNSSLEVQKAYNLKSYTTQKDLTPLTGVITLKEDGIWFNGSSGMSSLPITKRDSFTLFFKVELTALNSLTVGEWFVNQRSLTSGDEQNWQLVRFSNETQRGSFTIYTPATSYRALINNDSNIIQDVQYIMIGRFNQDEDTITGFRNGNFVGDPIAKGEENVTSGIIYDNSSNMVVSGRGFDITRARFTGYMRDLTIINKALTDEQIINIEL